MWSVVAVAGVLVTPAPAADGAPQPYAPGARISVNVPPGWHSAKRLTNVISPPERLALATFPLRGGSIGGECAPERALEDIGPHDAFLWLLEYRPFRGPVWHDLRRRDFPPRPQHFELRRSEFARNIDCYLGPGLRLSFRAANRPFQLFVALGARAGEPRLRQLERILDSLRIGALLPPPPPDPYLDWKLLTTESGDSFRPPPGWAAAATFMPRSLPRPRALFFASNVPLAGLPSRFTPRVPELPSPFPAEALARFPARGVLAWALEEETGGASPEFPLIRRGWPRAGDFARATGPIDAPPGVKWRRAGGSFRGYRFSIWVVSGRSASKGAVALALKSARTFAVSACQREPAGGDCPEQ